MSNAQAPPVLTNRSLRLHSTSRPRGATVGVISLSAVNLKGDPIPFSIVTRFGEAVKLRLSSCRRATPTELGFEFG
jgi:hypothetical protein